MLKNASARTSIAFALTHTVPIHEKLVENKLVCLLFDLFKSNFRSSLWNAKYFIFGSEITAM